MPVKAWYLMVNQTVTGIDSKTLFQGNRAKSCSLKFNIAKCLEACQYRKVRTMAFVIRTKLVRFTSINKY